MTASTPRPSLDHVQLAAPAGCESAARAFYGVLLGLPELDKPAALAERGGAWFALGGAQLHIGVQEPFSPARQAHPALRLRDVATLELLAARLHAGGAPVRWDTAIPQLRRFFTEDPWGNRLELLADAAEAGAAQAALRSGAACSPSPR